jgi:S-formylglutathione hydrolase
MVTLVSESKHFDGYTRVYEHQSEVTKTMMKFGAYVPSQVKVKKAPTVVWLSGLTCTEQNFLTKAGAQQTAEELGLILIAPDTSPRGLNLPGEHESYDFGSGAGFYLDATQQPWAEHYRMETYITRELLSVAEKVLPIDLSRVGICGHSMGGHGALTLGLKHPKVFKSISAFSPICQPTECPWGRKAFEGYLGSDPASWKNYDATYLLQSETSPYPILIDQGTKDEFLENQLKTPALERVVKARGLDIKVRYQEGYDHSYYFISTFIADHLRHHSRYLK